MGAHPQRSGCGVQLLDGGERDTTCPASVGRHVGTEFSSQSCAVAGGSFGLDGGFRTCKHFGTSSALTWSQLPGAPGWIAEQSAANCAPFSDSGQLRSVPQGARKSVRAKSQSASTSSP